MTDLPYWVLKAPLWGNRGAHQAATDTPSQRGTRREGVRFLGVGGNWSARRKCTKVGMESANQIHIQPLASYIGERTKPTCLATGVVCYPDTEQKRPYKIPWSCWGLNRGSAASQARTLPVCHTTPHLKS